MSLFGVDRVALAALRTAKIRGIHPAIIVDNKDGEGNPGYRVKVKFPWLNEQEASFWARIAVPMAGSSRGTYVLPEIDDQVLVVFEHGDINRPIVIGGLWSKKQEPVEINQSGKNNTKLIKSRSGHRIIFDDKEGAEKITIVDKTRKNKIILDSANKLVKIESDGDIELIAKTNVIMHSNALKIATSDHVTGKASSLLAHSAKTFGLKASSAITIGGGATAINMSSGTACSVRGSGAGELGGPRAKHPKDPAEGHKSGVGETVRSGANNDGGTGKNDSQSLTSDLDKHAPAIRLTFIELKLADSDGRPVSFARYQVTGSDGAMFTGALDARGYARIDGVPEGTCKVTFPELHGGDWSAE